MSSFEKYSKYKNKYIQLKKLLKNSDVNLIGNGERFRQVTKPIVGDNYFYKDKNNEFIKVKYTEEVKQVYMNQHDYQQYIEFYKEDGCLNGIKILLNKPLYKLADDPPSYGEMEEVSSPTISNEYFIKSTNEFSDEVYIPVILTKIVSQSSYKGGIAYYETTIKENGITLNVFTLYNIKQTILPPQEVFRIVVSPKPGNKYYFKQKDPNGEDFYFETIFGSYNDVEKKYESKTKVIKSDKLYEKIK